jgi:hypothetical protein
MTDSSRSAWMKVAESILNAETSISNMCLSQIAAIKIGLVAVNLERSDTRLAGCLKLIDEYLDSPHARTLRAAHGGVPPLKTRKRKS